MAVVVDPVSALRLPSLGNHVYETAPDAVRPTPVPPKQKTDDPGVTDTTGCETVNEKPELIIGDVQPGLLLHENVAYNVWIPDNVGA